MSRTSQLEDIEEQTADRIKRRAILSRENPPDVPLVLGKVRDSKNPAGPTLNIDLAGFLVAVKAGRLG